MKISSEQYERLMRFMDLDMTVGEMKAFAEELDADPELREQLQFEEQVRDGLDTLYGENGKSLPVADFTEEELAEIQKETANADEEKNRSTSPATLKIIPETGPHIKKGKVLNMQFSTAVAATLLIAVALVCLVTTGPSVNNTIVKNRDTGHIKKPDDNLVKNPVDTTLKTPEKRDINLASLFKSFYRKDTVPQIKPDIYASALSDYQDNYYRTIQKIDPGNLPEVRGPETNPLNSKKSVETIGHYYTGLSFIETNDLDKAVADLQWVIDHSGDEVFVVKAQWYLSLAYLKKGNLEEGKQLLRKVAGNTALPSYSAKAKSLLKKME